jgi:carbon-monoxide dehydrogenase large subunit
VAVTGATGFVGQAVLFAAGLHGIDVRALTRRKQQLRGGVVQGLGAALFEECLYDSQGQLLNATMADYLVPMAAEMPDMVIGHVETPTKSSELGAKGAGEAGTAGAPAAVMNAINDALAPFNARVTDQPFTPERLLKALGRV